MFSSPAYIPAGLGSLSATKAYSWFITELKIYVFFKVRFFLLHIYYNKNFLKSQIFSLSIFKTFSFDIYIITKIFKKVKFAALAVKGFS